MLRPLRLVILLLFLLCAASSVFAGDEPCPSPELNMPFRVAYAHHFAEPEGRTLSLKVSIADRYQKTPELLHRVGCAIAAKYKNERRWHVLVFSDYGAAKSYVPPYPDQNEPRSISAVAGSSTM
jgi:hypothetical protein